MIHLVQNRMHSHKVLQINYTTYDMRCCQDSLNPRTHSDIMVHAPESEPNGHPYWYTRILGIYHAWVSRSSSSGLGPDTPPRKLEFLWVRWFKLDPTAPGGFTTRRLHRIHFIEHDSAEDVAFGFIDPSTVIRAVHMIGAFAFGHTNRYLPPSIVRQPSENHEDWNYYYVGM